MTIVLPEVAGLSPEAAAQVKEFLAMPIPCGAIPPRIHPDVRPPAAWWWDAHCYRIPLCESCDIAQRFQLTLYPTLVCYTCWNWVPSNSIIRLGPVE